MMRRRWVVGFLGLVELCSCAGDSKDGATLGETGDAGIGTGGAGGSAGGSSSGRLPNYSGGSGGSGGRPPDGSGGCVDHGGQPVVDCHHDGFGSTAGGPGIVFSTAIGTSVTPTAAQTVRVCRNGTCAAVPIANVATIQFGDAGADIVGLRVTNQSGADVLSASWRWEADSHGYRNGDIYTFELFDDAGVQLLSQQKKATYSKYSVSPGECSAPLQCIRVDPTDVTPEVDAGIPPGLDAGTTLTDAGTSTRTCCPRDAAAPPSTGDRMTCSALGGADYGGCFKTCACPAPHVAGKDEFGCDTWVRDTSSGTGNGYCPW